MADWVAALQQADESISDALVLPSKWREACKWVEWTVHGIPWIVGSSLGLIIAYGRRWSDSTQHQLVILNFGLLADLIVTGFLKLTVQRPRPRHNIDDMVYEAPVADQFSFPSGHTSRAAMLTTMCATMYPQMFPYVAWLPFLVAWSRVAMGRHYVSDVIAGLAIGYTQGKLALLLPFGCNVFLRRILS